MDPRERPLYHITHLDNLPAILDAGGLKSDRRLRDDHPRDGGGPHTAVGLDRIKRRRLEELPVTCRPGTSVGDYVPFYFCPRSVMLYLIHRRNEDLRFRGGQDEIVHLVTSVGRAVDTAESSGPDRWAFSEGNAGAYGTRFSADLTLLARDRFVRWDHVAAERWNTPPERKRFKQAELLVRDAVPWSVFVGIGVHNRSRPSEGRGDPRPRRGHHARPCPPRLVLLTAMPDPNRHSPGLRTARGNLLEADADALVNTVNTVGVMGKGIALQFKRAFPENFREYKRACDHGGLDVGQVLTHTVPAALSGPKYLFNLPTKRHWRGDSRLEWVESGLAALVAEVRRLGVSSVAVPPLGCGNGGLAWADVRPLIETAFRAVPEVEVLLFEPGGAPAAGDMPVRTRRPPMTAGRAAVLGLIRAYRAALLDVELSLLELHKLAYFLQRAGEPLRLEFVPGPYGPYAENLRHVLARLEGHFITGFGDGGEAPGKTIEADRAALVKADAYLTDKADTRGRLDRVRDLIDGFEDPFGMKLLATVDWVATAARPPARDAEEAIRMVHRWTHRKKRVFAPEHIDLAWRHLGDHGWLPE